MNGESDLNEGHVLRLFLLLLELSQRLLQLESRAPATLASLQSLTLHHEL